MQFTRLLFSSVVIAVTASMSLAMNPKYSSYLQKLYQINVGNPVKLGLQNSIELYEALGKPTANTAIVHVAGTNGKGSVAIKVAETLRLSGYKTGIHDNSPHETCTNMLMLIAICRAVYITSHLIVP